jgi:CheY-like chemotaxis protein
MSLEKYVVGRGCDACGQSGYLGVIGLHSILRVTEPVAKAFAEGAGQAELVKNLYPKGLRPLLEDGVRKALDGLTTFEAVNKAVKSAPQVYVELWKQREEAPEAPFQAEPRSRAPHAGEPLFSRSAPKVKKDRPTVLVVEDDPDQRSILEMALKGAEYEVEQAANGVEALEKMQAGAPDLILCDLMMPKMDGSELVSRLKQDAKYSRIPILMLTMIADEEKEYALLDLGADDYCDKTIQRKTLLKRIENLIRRSA